MKITKDEALLLLEQTVEAKGEDYIYPADERLQAGFKAKCSYSEHGAPSCIVGHVINMANPEVFQELAQWEQENESSFALTSNAVRDILDEKDYVGSIPEYEIDAYTKPVEDVLDLFEPEAIKVLNYAQSWQDSGKSWGKALTAAKNGGYA